MTDDELRELVERARQRLATLGGFVDDLFDAVRLDTGELQISAEVVDVRALVDQVVADARVTDPARRIDVDGAEEVTALGDPQRTWQILSNLVSNALKFSPPDAAGAGSPPGWRRERGRRGGRWWTRCVGRAARAALRPLRAAAHERHHSGCGPRAVHRSVARRGTGWPTGAGRPPRRTEAPPSSSPSRPLVGHERRARSDQGAHRRRRRGPAVRAAAAVPARGHHRGVRGRRRRRRARRGPGGTARRRRARPRHARAVGHRRAPRASRSGRTGADRGALEPGASPLGGRGHRARRGGVRGEEHAHRPPDQRCDGRRPAAAGGGWASGSSGARPRPVRPGTSSGPRSPRSTLRCSTRSSSSPRSSSPTPSSTPEASRTWCWSSSPTGSGSRSTTPIRRSPPSGSPMRRARVAVVSCCSSSWRRRGASRPPPRARWCGSRCPGDRPPPD